MTLEIGKIAGKLPAIMVLIGSSVTALAGGAKNRSVPKYENCLSATVISPAEASIPEKSAISMLVDEVAKRTGERWREEAALSKDSEEGSSGCLVFVADQAHMRSLLTVEFGSGLRVAPQIAEGFGLRTFRSGRRIVVEIEGYDARGVLFGIGELLRRMEMEPHRAILELGLSLSEAPVSLVRSHQLGYRFKNNTYDAWALGQFEQAIRDLAVFGANTIQLIAPESDDAKMSPLFPAPALETLIGVSKILDRYGLNCDIFYPEMEQDYARSTDVERELARFEALVRLVPRLDAVYVPGGDPGHTPPDLLFPLVEKEAAILRRYHPGAKMYVSAQGMDAAHYEDFYRWMNRHPKWLDGVFFGPQSRDSMETQRARIPAEYPILFYPDIGHTMHAQFPVPEWDPVFALTEGREPIDPRPVDEGVIYRHFAKLNEGFVTYSEGVNDDVNKMLWTRWGWDPKVSARAILEQYSRYFIGPRLGHQFTEALFDLEQDWRGPIQSNGYIGRTLSELKMIEHEPAAPRDNWRLELALYRGYYDAYLRARLIAERAQENNALSALREASKTGATEAIDRAERALAPPQTSRGAVLRARVFELAGDLYRHIGMQLSVKLYGASNWERGANLDRIDIPLNNRVWYGRQFAEIRSLKDSIAQLRAIDSLVNWETPVVGAFYDDLGDAAREPHLVRGRGFTEDPEMYATGIDGVADRTSEDGWRWSQLSYAEMLYERPIELRYEGLDPQKHYRLRVTYAGEDYAVPVRLLANAGAVPDVCSEHRSEAVEACSRVECGEKSGCVELQAPTLRLRNPQVVEFDIPVWATHSGSLDLQWIQAYGQGGSGRGNQVAEVWLIPADY